MAHEIAGVMVASLIALVFVSAFAPGSQAGQVLKSALTGWATVLNSVRGGGGTTAVA